MGSFSELLTEAARAEGFPLAGAVDIDLAFAAAESGIAPHVERYRRWIDAGHAGSMAYLVRGLDRRADPRLVFPGAKTVLCVAIPYPVKPAGAADPEFGPRYARYLQGDDYHVSIAEGLERVMNRVAARRREAGLREPAWKVCVDTSAVLERSWAALAGLGWIGKNTLLIHPQLGSYLFLGEVLIDEETGEGPRLLPDYCGSCTRCLDACPTGAFRAPRELDSRRCVSYLTLEQRGEFELPPEEQPKMASWVAGCDACQESCPFNTKPAKREAAATNPAQESGAVAIADWRGLLEESEPEYRSRVKNSALKRVKPHQFRRNLLLALRNAVSGAPEDVRVRMATELQPVIERGLARETDALALREWEHCARELGRYSAKRSP